MSPQIDHRHAALRGVLRAVGPAVVFVGLIFVVIGFGSFFATFGSFGPPRYFWCAFVGLPLLAVGMALCRFAFLGAVSRYVANEVAPVGKDVVNYMADGTQEAVRTVAAAIGQGLRAGAPGAAVSRVRCPECQADNEVTANFCSQCGAAISSQRTCRGCGAVHDIAARFCAKCGEPLA